MPFVAGLDIPVVVVVLILEESWVDRPIDMKKKSTQNERNSTQGATRRSCVTGQVINPPGMVQFLSSGDKFAFG